MQRSLLSLSGLCLTALLFTTTQAQAGIVLTYNPGLSSTGAFVYDYVFTSALDPTAGANSDRMEGSGPNQAFGTLYDIPGFSSAALNAAFSSVLSLSLNTVGLTPPLVNPVDTALQNVSLRYIGPTVTTDTTFAGAVTVRSTNTAINTQGQYSGLDTKNVGPLAGTAISSAGFVAIPGSSVPEPATLGLLGFSLIGLGFFKRRARS